MAGSHDAAEPTPLGDYFLTGELVGRYPEAYEFLCRFAELRTAAAAANRKPKLKTRAHEWRKLIEESEEFAHAVENAARDFDETMASSLLLRCAGGSPLTRRYDNRTTLALLERMRPELVGGRPVTGNEATKAVAEALLAMHRADGTTPPEVAADAGGTDAEVVPAGPAPGAGGSNPESGAVQGGSGGTP